MKAGLLITGFVLIGAAILADRIGIGRPGGIGTGQVLLSFLGLILILIAIVGRRIGELYRFVGLLVLTTLLTFAFLELVAIAVARLELLPTTETRLATYNELPYYQRQEWTSQYLAEAGGAENYQYQPYVMWRHEPFQGQMIVIDEGGVRRTPGAQCDNSARKVFTFGGSTMWGWGSPDWGTIPAYLQEALAKENTDAICVTNYGEDAFVSSQNLIQLIRLLQNGTVPDTVIFYDGVNDVFAGFESGQPGAHLYLEQASETFEETTHPLIEWIEGTRQFTLVQNLMQRGNLVAAEDGQLAAALSDNGKANLDALAEAVAETYLTNYEIVSGLADKYSFEFYFFWQPHIAVSQKPLTEDEREIKARMDPRLASLAIEAYSIIGTEADNYERLWYLDDVFQGRRQQIWIDEWGHITPEGNKLVASEILTILQHDKDASS